MARQVGHLAKNRSNCSIRIIYLRNIWNMYAQYYNQLWQAETLLLRLLFLVRTPMVKTGNVKKAKNYRRMIIEHQVTSDIG